ncbi:hypothetical protein EG240_02580 [Paenimyroides tangerinum]|uniref:Uncharacterized protein n=1 Tax=Paenimyroides tangerinum TaxID=2488728 RepID=A0A3P3WGG8_9FLAO|nr:hypothetical protein [Paenimyroides tangerinum]RRJ92689.1 hypothetical protein EG240_02580 [Paenimyroides tangerinum]
MERNSYLSENILKAIKYIPFLFVIFFIEEFITNYFYPEDGASTLAKILLYTEKLIYIIFFSWYFIVNKRFKSALIAIIFLIVFFIFSNNIQNIFDYYLPVENFINSDTLKRIIFFIIIIFTSVGLGFLYNKENKELDKKSWLHLSILNFCLLLIFNKSQSFFEDIIRTVTFNSESSEFIFDFIYYFIKSIQSISFLAAFYFLIGIIFQKQHIYKLTFDAIRFTNQYFKTALFFGISIFIFSFFNLIKYFISIQIKSIFESYNLIGILSIIIFATLYILVSRFIGLLFYVRAEDKNHYYGITSGTSWIPLLNIISLGLIMFEDKLKFFKPKNTTKAQIIHIAIGVFLILFFFRKGIIDMETVTLILVLFYITILLVANFNKSYHWITSCLFGIILCLILKYNSIGYYEGFEKIEMFLSISIFLSIIIYGIYFILQKSMCVEK